MRKLALFALLAAMPALASAALAFDNGQYDNVAPDIRAWFKSVMAPNGVPCCDISDGHRTEYDVRNGAYWVPIEGQWMAVPDRAVIRDRGNPVGEAVVWYVHHRGRYHHQLFCAGGCHVSFDEPFARGGHHAGGRPLWHLLKSYSLEKGSVTGENLLDR